MADNCSTASSASSAPTGLSSQSGRDRTQAACRKQKQELRRERVRRAASLKTDDVTAAERGADKNNCNLAPPSKTTTAQEPPVNAIKDTTLKIKYDADANKVSKLKDQELNKLRQDLARCQLELREEVEKRGQSTSARTGFDQERRRLVGELREAGEAKRRLELALEAASATIKRKTAEMREMQDAEKLKIAALEKSANNEIRKLLDDLKNKDQQIAAMQSADRSGQTKKDKLNQAKGFSKKNHHHHSPQQTLEPQESNFDSAGSNIFPNLSGNITAQRRIYLLEKQLQQWVAANEYLNKCNKEYEEEKLNLEKSVEKLQCQNRQLKSDLETLKVEAAKLTELLSEKNILLIKDQIEILKETNHGQKLIIESMHQDGRSILNKDKPERKKHRKTLSFLLPGDTAPTPGGKFPMFIDESTMTESDLFLNGSIEPNKFNNVEVAIDAIENKEPEKLEGQAPAKDAFNENKIINDYVTGDVNEIEDPITPSAIKLGDECGEYYDEEMEEEHLQMEASFELMMQQEMMHQEQIHNELMQQELLQHMQMQWEEEKENMCYELIELKEKLKKKKVPTATLR